VQIFDQSECLEIEHSVNLLRKFGYRIGPWMFSVKVAQFLRVGPKATKLDC